MPKYRVEFRTEPQIVCPQFQEFEFVCCGPNHADKIAEEVVKPLKSMLKECYSGATLFHSVFEIFEGKKEIHVESE